jgi:hypothetical protein
MERPAPSPDCLCIHAEEITMAEKDPKDPHPGMMGDGTEEQNLNQPGDPSKRITEEEVDEAFTKDSKLVPKE